MEQYYFDTSIWVDIYERRGEHGEAAQKLIALIILNDWVVCYSDSTIIELKGLGYTEQAIRTMLEIAKPDHIRRVHTNREQIALARALAKQRDIPMRDALHAVLARDHGMQLVSRDQDFEKLRDVTQVRKPEELIDIDT